MSVDAANPGRGDIAGIAATARERSRKAQTIRDAAGAVDRAVADATSAVWTGQARDAFVETATTLAAELRTSADRLDAEAAAFTAYGRGVQEVQDVQRILELRRTELRGALASYRRQRADAQNDGTI